MKIRATILLIPTLLILFFLVVSAKQSHPSSTTMHRLAIEIGLDKPWTLNAAREGQTLRAFVRLPSDHQRVITYSGSWLVSARRP
jgi:hypothetical protein